MPAPDGSPITDLCSIIVNRKKRRRCLLHDDYRLFSELKTDLIEITIVNRTPLDRVQTFGKTTVFSKKVRLFQSRELKRLKRNRRTIRFT